MRKRAPVAIVATVEKDLAEYEAALLEKQAIEQQLTDLGSKAEALRTKVKTLRARIVSYEVKTPMEARTATVVLPVASTPRRANGSPGKKKTPSGLPTAEQLEAALSDQDGRLKASMIALVNVFKRKSKGHEEPVQLTREEIAAALNIAPNSAHAKLAKSIALKLVKRIGHGLYTLA